MATTKQPAPECVFRCEHCGATDVYDDSNGFYLVAWWAHADAFDAKHQPCKPPPEPAVKCPSCGFPYALKSLSAADRYCPICHRAFTTNGDG